jgi:hypothetical protein
MKKKQNSTTYYEMVDMSTDHPLFHDGSPDVRSVIVEIGCSVYRNLSIWTDVLTSNTDDDMLTTTRLAHSMEIENMRKQTSELKRKHMCDEISHDESMERSRVSHSEYVDTMHGSIQELKGKLLHIADEVESKKNEEILVLRQRIEDNHTCFTKANAYVNDQKQSEIERLGNTHKELVNSLQDHISLLKDKLSTLAKDDEKNNNVVHVGQVGEQYVCDYICDNFQNGGYLDNTSKKAGFGDMHFLNETDGIDILIEVKNKDTITPYDVSKFRRDIESCQSTGGLFVSIKKGVNVPCHSAFDVEWLDDKTPMIFVTNFEQYPNMVYVALRTLLFYGSLIKKTLNGDKDNDMSAREEEEKRNTKIMEAFNGLSRVMKMCVPLVDNAYVHLKQALCSIETVQATLKKEADESITLLVDNFDLDRIYTIFDAHFAEHGNLPKVGYLYQHGIDRSTVSKYDGFLQLKKMYNSRTKI